MSNASAGERRKIGSVQRAVDILNLFNSQTPQLGITEIAQALNLHKSTASGLITTLEANGYLDQDSATRKYQLGLKLVERSSLVLNQIEVRKVALPLLEQLRDKCGESVNLAIRDGVDVVYVERVRSLRSLGTREEIGKRASIHCTALGKAMTAWLPPGELKQLVSRCDLYPLTQNTITDREQLILELERTRERGFAIDDEEIEMGVRCVASPIFNHVGRPFAGVSVSAPVTRMPIDGVSAVAEIVLDTAKSISTRLGYIQRPF